MGTQKTTPRNAKHPKYNIRARLALMYGELDLKTGYQDLAAHCSLANTRSISEDWVKIPAGSKKSINRLVLPKVLEFFGAKKEADLFTQAHKTLLLQNAVTA